MFWTLDSCIVRPFASQDAASLARHADNRKVWLNLRDRMPHPYRRADAETFIAAALAAHPVTSFAIEVEGEAAGCIGFTLHGDIERCAAEVGYWLGEAYWGRGILTAVLRATSPWALEAYSLTRLFALPFADNAASCRVLEKAGYQLEGTMRASAIKDGQIKDQGLYALVRTPADGAAGFLTGHGP